MLKDRDKLILTRLSEGKRDKEIARELGLHPITIRHEVRLICARLDVHTRIEAVAKWLRGKPSST